MNSLVLGIDTGGTYTDAVLLEYESRRMLAAHKALTTRRNFAIGIEAVIEGIHLDDPAAIKMVSISTTLATNAIAEGKSKRAALFLIGYDAELIAKFKMAGRLGTPHYAYFEGGHDLYGREKSPLDLPAVLTKVNEIKNDVDAIAISSYFSPLNPEHELRAYEAVSRVCDLPLVLGHQLSTKLGSVERATTAALNASLLAVLQQFIIAVRRAMEQRQIDAPLMVVRGDGTLMSAEFAARTPVETIHSGPAASAIGGRFLSRLDNALVVDVGGTTTDIALIEDGRVKVSAEGATVGGYKTAVQAANLLSIALGGDSHIRQSAERKLTIGPERVVPLAYLAQEYPNVHSQLKTLSHRLSVQTTADWLEYWFLRREPSMGKLDTSPQRALPVQRKLVKLLRDGPQPLPAILKRLNLLHVGQLDAGDLWREEILGKAGLTPTDLLHVDGRHTLWNVEAAKLAADVFYKFLYRAPEELHQQVWAQMTETIVRAIVAFLTERELPPPARPADNDLGRWFFFNSLYDEHPHLESRLRLRYPLIGIGAPAAVLLPDVAKLLHTELILPAHHAVANAVGAVAGSVMATVELLVYPLMSREGLEVLGYYVQSGDGHKRSQFDELDDALTHARQLSREQALGAAVRSGADNPQVVVTETADGLDTYRIRAKAVSNPRFAS